MTPERLQALHDAKLRAELAAADALLPGGDPDALAGDPRSRAVLVAQARSAGAFEAATKALAALGFDESTPFSVVTRSVDAAPGLRALRLAAVIEAVDPVLVVAIDAGGAEDLESAYGLSGLRPGEPVRVRGRVAGSVGDLGVSLADDAAKRRAWGAFKALAVALPTGTRTGRP
ncbi:MAG: hypothetical protein Q7W30_02985 [Coriobacteriia bacterium]|nr:hypothetical protein [Coriobacteriia bacterium]